VKLIGFKKITGKIRLDTGLHIGGSADATQIGGVDNPVIRQPLDGKPYIPGSSLKGKMRSLLELELGKINKDGELHKYTETCANERCPICYIFGAAATEDAPIGPGRLIVRDCLVHKDSEKDLERLRDERGLPYAEDKPEISINRITARPHLRNMERVPAGICFALDISYRVFDNNGDEGQRDKKLFDYVLRGLALIQQDTLGGSGSRGYGKVSFVDLRDENGDPITLPEVVMKCKNSE
jgi:CRISPR-associated protein Csm3